MFCSPVQHYSTHSPTERHLLWAKLHCVDPTAVAFQVGNFNPSCLCVRHNAPSGLNEVMFDKDFELSPMLSPYEACCTLVWPSKGFVQKYVYCGCIDNDVCKNCQSKLQSWGGLHVENCNDKRCCEIPAAQLEQISHSACMNSVCQNMFHQYQASCALLPMLVTSLASEVTQPCMNTVCRNKSRSTLLHALLLMLVTMLACYGKDPSASHNKQQQCIDANLAYMHKRPNIFDLWSLVTYLIRLKPTASRTTYNQVMTTKHWARTASCHYEP